MKNHHVVHYKQFICQLYLIKAGGGKKRRKILSKQHMRYRGESIQAKGIVRKKQQIYNVPGLYSSMAG